MGQGAGGLTTLDPSSLPEADPAVCSSSGRLRNSNCACWGREPVWEAAAHDPTLAMHTDTVKVA